MMPQIHLGPSFCQSVLPLVDSLNVYLGVLIEKPDGEAFLTSCRPATVSPPRRRGTPPSARSGFFASMVAFVLR
jgi:hypothetical protein